MLYQLSYPSPLFPCLMSSVWCCTNWAILPLCFPVSCLQSDAVPTELSFPSVSLSNVFSLMLYQLSYPSPLFPCLMSSVWCCTNWAILPLCFSVSCLQSVAVPTELSFPSVSISNVFILMLYQLSYPSPLFPFLMSSVWCCNNCLTPLFPCLMSSVCCCTNWAILPLCFSV